MSLWPSPLDCANGQAAALMLTQNPVGLRFVLVLTEVVVGAGLRWGPAWRRQGACIMFI